VRPLGFWNVTRHESRGEIVEIREQPVRAQRQRALAFGRYEAARAATSRSSRTHAGG